MIRFREADPMTQPWRGRAQPATLGDDDFANAALHLGSEPAAIRAVWEVEAAGRHFAADGAVIHRFEPHHMPREHWAALGFDPGVQPPWRASRALPESRRRAMFDAACALEPEAALRASSWGAPQIMGFNHRDAGFSTARAMVAEMAKGAPQQLAAFVHLVEAWGLGGALRAQDWTAFARRYNGSGDVDGYVRKIEQAYRRATGHASPAVLRVGDRGEEVERLQAALGVEVDGAFGPATLAAVKAFQTRAGLHPDGVVGAVTWEALDAVLAEAGLSAPDKPLPPAPPTLVARLTPHVRSALRALGGVLIGWGVSAEDAALLTANPAVEGAVTIIVAELWYALARRNGWAT